MKKRLCILFILLLIFPIVSAIEINMNSEYSQGQTVIASVSGNFIDSITKDNIYFYRGNVRTSFDYDVARIGDKYYFYFQLSTKSPNNYSVVIKDVRYFVGSQVVQDEMKKDFTIISGTADFSVKPGFVVTSENFSLQIQNIMESEITIEIDSQEFKTQNSVTLLSGEIENIEVGLINTTETTITTINLNTDNLKYEIPVYVIAEFYPEEQNQSEENETQEQEEETEECTWFEKLFGLCGDEQEENENQEQDNQILETVEENKSQEQNQSGNQTEGLNETEEETIIEPDYEIIEEEDGTLIVIEDGEIMEVEATFKTCAEMKGDVCEEGELCNTKTVYAKDSKCCISSCVKEEESQNTKIIAWVIIGAILLIIIWFFKSKFSKTKNKKDVLLGKK